FLAAGLNYQAHAEESRMATPEVPVIFNKAVTCLTGPYDPVEIPTVAPDQVDYEGELGVVIGTRCRAVPAERALEVVAGYLVRGAHRPPEHRLHPAAGDHHRHRHPRRCRRLDEAAAVPPARPTGAGRDRRHRRHRQPRRGRAGPPMSSRPARRPTRTERGEDR